MTREQSTRLLRGILLVTISAGVLVRIFGLRYGSPQVYYRDEDDVVESALYTLTGDPNPHLYKYPGFLPGILSFAYRVSFLGLDKSDPNEISSVFIDYQANPFPEVILGRAIALFLALIVIPSAYVLGKSLWGRSEGLLSAALIAVSPLHIDLSRVARVDAPAAAFVLLALAASVLFRQSERDRYMLLAGIAAGLAAGCKYYAGFVALPIAIICFPPGGRTRRSWLRLVVLALVTLATFLLTSPHIFTSFGEFQQKAQYLANLYGRPYWGIEGESTLSGLAVELVRYAGGAIGFFGLLLFLLSAVRNRSGSFIPILATLGYPAILILFFFRSETFFLRFFIPAVPPLCVAAGRGLAMLLDSRMAVRWKAIAILLVIPLLYDSGRTGTHLVRTRDSRVLARDWLISNSVKGLPVVLGSRRSSPWLASADEPFPHEAKILRARLKQYSPDYLQALDDAREKRVTEITGEEPLALYQPGRYEEMLDRFGGNVAVVITHQTIKSDKREAKTALLNKLEITHSVAARFDAGWSSSLGPDIEIWMPRRSSANPDG